MNTTYHQSLPPGRTSFWRRVFLGFLCGLASAVLAADAPGGESTTAGTLSVGAQRPRAEWQKRLTLGPGDTINLAMFGSPELTKTDVPVGPDGRISYLQAEDVPALGMTIDELRARLEQELSKFYRNPHVIITPVAYKSKRYYMLGKVATKGVFTLDRPLTIIEAVAQARGFETGLFEGNTVEIADLARSFLVRSGKKLPVDFEKLFQQGDLTQNVPLEPGDYLYFPSANVNEIYVLGEVNNPGVSSFTPKATVVTAIALRGSFTDRAWRQKVLVVRGSVNHPEPHVVNVASILAGKEPDFQLKPKDIVYVSDRPWILAEDLLDNAVEAFIHGAVITWTGVNIYPSQTGNSNNAR